MQPWVTTYRQRVLRRPDGAEQGDAATDPRSFGMEMDDPGGHFRIEQLTLGPGDAVLSRLSSTGYRGTMRDDDNYTFVLQRRGRYAVRISGRDYAMSRGGLLAFRPNERKTRILADASGLRAAVTLQLPVARMHALARAMETSANAAFPHDGLALQGPGGLTLWRVLPQLCDDLFLRPDRPLPPRLAQNIIALIDEVLCELIGRTVTQPASRRIFPAFHRVRQAEEMMHASSDEPLSMLALATALGVSLRSLQLAFNEVHGGQSPREVLNRIRLEKVRQRLLAATEDDRVTTIALDSGFFHLSRFAQAYARAFGERPSETLARRRA